MNHSQIAKALASMAKLMPGGERIDEEAGDFLIKALGEFDEKTVLNSLNRCFRELKFFPTISEIIDRIDDGRPGVEEAWAMAPKGDSEAAYLNDEIINAWTSASGLLKSGSDMIAARMAFKEVYDREVKKNRTKGIKPKWWLSRASGPGSEFTNQAALRDAVEKQRITIESAQRFMPGIEFNQPPMAQIDGPAHEIKQLINQTMKGSST